MLEQLVTAGTITEICVWRMIRIYKRERGKRQRANLANHVRVIEEGGVSEPFIGKLSVGYYHPRPNMSDDAGEPVKMHIKCSVIDNQVIVLGSGNMDRASWYTSQELGIALYDRDVARSIWTTSEQALEGRVERYFNA